EYPCRAGRPGGARSHRGLCTLMPLSAAWAGALVRRGEGRAAQSRPGEALGCRRAATAWTPGHADPARLTPQLRDAPAREGGGLAGPSRAARTCQPVLDPNLYGC